MSDYYIERIAQAPGPMRWWGVGGNGFTLDIENAQRFLAEEARDIVDSQPLQFRAWPVRYVRSLSKVTVFSKEVSHEQSWHQCDEGGHQCDEGGQVL